MDLLCPKCGEPWDNDELHELAEAKHSSYKRQAARFRSLGCEAFGVKHNDTPRDSFRVVAAQAAYELLGDDMDGAAALIDDWL